MKILLVIDQFDNSNNGTTISARRFAKGLQEAGHEVYVVSTGNNENEYKFCLKELPLPPGISHFISNGVDPDFRLYKKDKLPEFNDKFVITILKYQ